MPHFKQNNDVFAVARSFGAGVILATGLIHILPEAQEVLSEAIPDVDYPISAGLCLTALVGPVFIHKLTHRISYSFY